MEVRRYLSLFWRWVWLILLGTAAAGATAFLLSTKTTPVYRASSRLLIDEAPGGNGSNDYSQLLLEQRLAQTYVEIINTRPVHQATIERLNLPFPAETLATMLSVAALPDTKIIVISVEDSDPARAADIANTVGELFIVQNQARESLRYAEPIANWESRINRIGDEIQALETQLNAFDPAGTAEEQAALARLQTQRNEAQIRYTEAFNNLNELQVAQARESSNLVQIEQAQPPPDPIRPRTMSNTILAAIAGAMTTLGLVILIEHADDTIKIPDQILEDTALSTLGVIAFITENDTTSRLITVCLPGDPISEAYRVLRTNLSLPVGGETAHTILVTSSLPGEGKSTTAANLAVVLAQMGRRVILVDADLRRPVQHKVFEATNDQGLTTAILDNSVAIGDLLQKTKVAGLAILTSGPIPFNPADCLDAQRLAQVLAALGNKADIMILDTPPVLSAADVSILAPLVDKCLLVVEVNKTRRVALVQTVARLQKVNAQVSGTVMNRLRPGRGNGYYYTAYYDSLPAIGRSPRPRFNSIQTRLPAWLAGPHKRYWHSDNDFG